MMRDLLTGLKLNNTDHSRHSATKSCLRNGMALTDLEDCYGAIFFLSLLTMTLCILNP